MTSPQHTYRRLLREINRQFTSVNGNRAWATQMRQQWIAASQNPAGSNMHAAQNILAFLTSNRKHGELISEFYPRMPEGDRIEKTARRVGLEAPKMYNPESPS